MSKPKSQGVINKGDYRPQSEPGKGPHSKPIYNPGDYRPNYFGDSAGAKGKGGKGKGKKAKIFHYSHRLAPGATRDPWGGVGR